VTDAGLQSRNAVSDKKQILTRKPNIIVSIPVDPRRPCFCRAAAPGVKLVFMDNSPKGVSSGKHYIGIISRRQL
jgi:ribose transport system substrate-binding protein